MFTGVFSVVSAFTGILMVNAYTRRQNKSNGGFLCCQPPLRKEKK